MDNTVDTNVNTGTNPGVDATQTAKATGADVPPSPTEDGDITTPVQSDAVKNSKERPFDYSILDIPEEFKASAEFMDGLKQTVDKYGLISSDPKQVMQGFINYIRDEAIQSNEAEDQREITLARENEESLKKDAEFGKDFFGNMKYAVDSIEKFGGKELSEFMKANPSMNHPAIIKAFANIGKQMSDAKIITGNSAPATPSRPMDVNGNPMLDFSNSFPSKK